MSTVTITHLERLDGIANLPPLPYFVHEQYAMKMLGFNNKDDFNTFIDGIINGSHEGYDAINIELLMEDNILHLHRQKYGWRCRKSNRKDITNEPSVNVLKQEEMYYSFGLFQREGMNLSLKNQVTLARTVVGESNVGLKGGSINIRKDQWQMCMSGNADEVRRQVYFNNELPNIVQK